MKNFTKIAGFIIALVATSAQAVPTLYFDGDIDYTTATGELQVTAALTSTTDIAPSPLTTSSLMIFNAFFDSVVNTITGCPFCPGGSTSTTKGNFIGNSDPGLDDLRIFDGNGDLLLSAKFDSLSLEGADGGTRGELIGMLDATGGSLQYLFEGSDLFALQLGLSTSFASDMYDWNLRGQVDGNISGVDGNISGVPEPTILALLGLGILLNGFARRSKI